LETENIGFRVALQNSLKGLPPEVPGQTVGVLRFVQAVSKKIPGDDRERVGVVLLVSRETVVTGDMHGEGMRKES
jgi:hypothetical protein